MNYTEVYKTWSEFKTLVSDLSLCAKFYKLGTGSEQADIFKCSALHDDLRYATDVAESATPGSDGKDFADNYQSIWNAQTEFRDPNGILRIHASPRPCNQHTYFAGAGDNGGTGSGTRMLFDMSAGDTQKSKTIVFNEDTWIKDGIVQVTGTAPLGACFDIEVLNTLDVVVKTYAKNVNILGDGPIYLNTEDSDLLPAGYKIKTTVYNSVAAEADNEAPKAFKVVGNIEMYRTTTV
jgi:hypothetical protein